MKQLLIAIVGLMSLLGLVSSCEQDTSTYKKTEEFYPYCYLIKDATTIQVMGVDQLCVAEKEKTDWEIIGQVEMSFTGSQSLQILGENVYRITDEDMDNNTLKLNFQTNADDIAEDLEDEDDEEDGESVNVLTIVVKGFLEPYTYMGKELQLGCFTPLKVEIDISIEEKDETVFWEKGNVIYTLKTFDGIVLTTKKVPYTIATIEGYRKHLNIEVKEEENNKNEKAL